MHLERQQDPTSRFSYESFGNPLKHVNVSSQSDEFLSIDHDQSASRGRSSKKDLSHDGLTMSTKEDLKFDKSQSNDQFGEEDDHKDQSSRLTDERFTKETAMDHQNFRFNRSPVEAPSTLNTSGHEKKLLTSDFGIIQSQKIIDPKQQRPGSCPLKNTKRPSHSSPIQDLSQQHFSSSRPIEESNQRSGFCSTATRRTTTNTRVVPLDTSILNRKECLLDSVEPQDLISPHKKTPSSFRKPQPPPTTRTKSFSMDDAQEMQVNSLHAAEQKSSSLTKDKVDHAGSQTTSKGLRELKVLEEDLYRCLDGVEELQSNVLLEAEAESLMNLTHYVGEEVNKVKNDYERALRKRVAIEAYNLSYLLKTLKKFETATQFEERRHLQLYQSLKKYHQLHFRNSYKASNKGHE